MPSPALAPSLAKEWEEWPVCYLPDCPQLAGKGMTEEEELILKRSGYGSQLLAGLKCCRCGGKLGGVEHNLGSVEGARPDI